MARSARLVASSSPRATTALLARTGGLVSLVLLIVALLTGGRTHAADTAHHDRSGHIAPLGDSHAVLGAASAHDLRPVRALRGRANPGPDVAVTTHSLRQTIAGATALRDLEAASNALSPHALLVFSSRTAGAARAVLMVFLN